MSRGNAVHNPPSLHFASQLRRRPVAHRDAAVLGLLAGHRDDRRELLGREPRRCSRSRLVRQDRANLRRQVSVGRRLLFGSSQVLPCAGPAVTPLADRASGTLQALRLLLVAHAVGAGQHDRHPFRQPPRRASRLDQVHQDRTLTQRHRDASGCSRHGGPRPGSPSLAPCPAQGQLFGREFRPSRSRPARRKWLPAEPLDARAYAAARGPCLGIRAAGVVGSRKSNQRSSRGAVRLSAG
jgi:hypothetical protein